MLKNQNLLCFQHARAHSLSAMRCAMPQRMAGTCTHSAGEASTSGYRAARLPAQRRVRACPTGSSVPSPSTEYASRMRSHFGWLPAEYRAATAARKARLPTRVQRKSRALCRGRCVARPRRVPRMVVPQSARTVAHHQVGRAQDGQPDVWLCALRQQRLRGSLHPSARLLNLAKSGRTAERGAALDEASKPNARQTVARHHLILASAGGREGSGDVNRRTAHGMRRLMRLLRADHNTQLAGQRPDTSWLRELVPPEHATDNRHGI